MKGGVSLWRHFIYNYYGCHGDLDKDATEHLPPTEVTTCAANNTVCGGDNKVAFVGFSSCHLKSCANRELA